MKTLTRIIRTVIVGVLILCVFIHFLPVSWEAERYGDNYKSYIYNKYVGEVVSCRQPQRI